MDKKPKKELIDGIKDFLRDFEEPYDPREWEYFQRKRKRRNPVPLFVKLAGVAASLFLLVYASVKFLPSLDTTDKKTEDTMSRRLSKPSNESDGQGKDTAALAPIPRAPDVDSVGRLDRDILQALGERELPDPVTSEPERTTPLLTDSLGIARTTEKFELKAIPFGKGLAGNQELPYGKREKTIGMEIQSRRPLVGGDGVDIHTVKVGIHVNPLFSNKGLSLGGGVSAQIPLSNKLYAEIGASYANMTVGTDMEVDKTDTVSIQTAGIRNAVGMVSLPVSLNYALTENFAASLGIVPFRVVSAQRTDILQTYRWVPGDIASGDTTGRLISERSESKRPDSLYKNTNYWGFIQLSGQVSPPFLKRYNAVIAPYIGIPVGQLRQDRYRWLHGGVSFRVYLR